MLRIWLAVAVWALVAASPAMAQRPDTVPRDTVPTEVAIPIPPEAVASDTLPGDSLMPTPPDSLVEAPELPPFPDPLPTGWAFGRWELSRDELLRYRGLSVLDLLERIPGVVVTRAGGFGRTAGVSTMGAGGGAVRVFIDGYETDPIGQPTPELQAIGLIDLESLRVERGPAGVRLELTTLRLPDQRPYSEVEAAAGNYGTRILRATLARVAGSRSVFSGSYDLVTTTGVGLAEPFQAGVGRVSWTYGLTPTTGLKLELRQGGVDRGGEAYPVDISRRDIILRARSAPFAGLTAEALIGRTWWSPEPGDTVPSESGVDTIRPDVARTQGLVRAAWTTSRGRVEASARLRGGDGGVPAPGTELALRGAMVPLPWVLAEAEVRSSGLGGGRATGIRAGGRIGPFAGLSAFGSIATGERWAGLAADTLITYPDTVGFDTVAGVPVPEIRERTRLETAFSARPVGAAGARVGGELARWGATLGAALVLTGSRAVVPFGFGFDRAIPPVQVEPASGIEAHARLPVPGTGRALSLDGYGAVWDVQDGRPYLPKLEARISLEYHAVRIEGQFEPTVRIEAVHRGETLVPTAAGDSYGFLTEPYNVINFFLQIRVLDVRAFLIWENIAHNRLALDLAEGPGFQPGQRVMYGARWFFRN